MKKKEPCYKKSVCAYVHKVTAGETLYKIARHYGVDYGRLMALNGITNPYNLRVGTEICIPPSVCSGIAGNCAGYYTIRKGDTLYSIARNFGLDLDDLMAANSDVDPYNMHVGMKICIPPRNPANRPMPRTQTQTEAQAEAPAVNNGAAGTERTADSSRSAGASDAAGTTGAADTAGADGTMRTANSSDTPRTAAPMQAEGSSDAAGRAQAADGGITARNTGIRKSSGAPDTKKTAKSAEAQQNTAPDTAASNSAAAQITVPDASVSAASSPDYLDDEKTADSAAAPVFSSLDIEKISSNISAPSETTNLDSIMTAADIMTSNTSNNPQTGGESQTPGTVRTAQPINPDMADMTRTAQPASPDMTGMTRTTQPAGPARRIDPSSSAPHYININALPGTASANNTSNDMVYTVLEAETVTEAPAGNALASGPATNSFVNAPAVNTPGGNAPAVNTPGGNAPGSNASAPRSAVPGSITSLPYVSDTMPDGIIYNVEQGETLTDILRKFGICFSALDYNNSSIDLNQDLSGLTLNIPYGDKICLAPNNQAYIIRRNDTLDNISVRFDISTDELLRLNPTKRPDDFSSIGGRINVSGDL